MNWTLTFLLFIPAGVFVIFALAMCGAAKAADSAFAKAIEEMRKRDITLPDNERLLP